jgi:hypothetical protein
MCKWSENTERSDTDVYLELVVRARARARDPGGQMDIDNNQS